MYARQSMDGRVPRNLRIPRNYSGNAFRREDDLPPNDSAELSSEISDPISSLPSVDDARETERTDIAANAETVSKIFPSPGFRLDLGRLLNHTGGGIGFEEILIIGLILLLSQSETKDDLILLLIVLLFVQ